MTCRDGSNHRTPPWRWITVLFVLTLASEAAGLQPSTHEIPITTDDTVAPAVGTLALIGISDELPPGAQVVAGTYTPGEPVLTVRASLSQGEIVSIGGIVTGAPPVGQDFCCVIASGYTARSDRIPGPDEFLTSVWEWFFDATAGPPGPLVPGEEAEIWVAFTQLNAGDRIEFFAYGPAPPPCTPGGCPSLGTVVVEATPVPALGGTAQLAILVALLSLSIAHVPRRSTARVGSPEAGRRS